MRLFSRDERNLVETSGARRELAADAGWGAVSGWSILSGTLAAYGAFAVLLAGAAALLASTDVESELSALNWDELGWGGAVAIAAVTFVAYLFGGYTAGRMARRAGATNGLMVAVLGVLLAVGVGALVAVSTSDDIVTRNLRTIGVPTTGGEWQSVGTVAGIATLAAMIIGALVGGITGERWHNRLLRRAVDPTVGAEAEMRDRAKEDVEDADARHTASTSRVHRATGAEAVALDRTDARSGDEDRDGDREVDVRESTRTGRSGPADS